MRTVVVKAPEGMGKQRLMAELRREIQLGDGLFVEGSCWTNDTSALGQDPQDFASRLDGGAETPRGLGEGERRRVRIRESRLGLPGGGADVVGPATGQ